MMNINGTQQRQLRDALLSAFPTRQDLEMMVSYGLYENLSAIAGDGTLEYTIFKLVQWAVARGKFEQLVIAALKENSHNPQLISIAKQLGLSNNPPVTSAPGTNKTVQGSATPSSATPAQSQVLPHSVAVPCSACGHMNYFDKRTICSGRGSVVRGDKKEPAVRESALYLRCQRCRKDMVVSVDCRGFE